MKIKSPEWIEFKQRIMSVIRVFDGEADKIYFPVENDDDFIICVEDCKVIPVFTKKENFMKVEYDFAMCDTSIRRISFSKVYDSYRIEMALKEIKN